VRKGKGLAAVGKNILFVSIFDLTRLFYEVSRGLSARGFNIFWLTTNEYWTRWLVDNGVDRSNIQQLVYDREDFLDDKSKALLAIEIVQTEARADLTINQALMMDQFVRFKNKPDINEYVYLYYRDIKRFLIDNQIATVFAEPTNINELITYLLCRELDIQMIAPRDGRYPLERLLFNEGFQQSKLLSGPNACSTSSGRQVLEEYAKRRPTPHYFARLSGLPVVDLQKSIKAICNRLDIMKNTSRRGLTHHDLRERLLWVIKRTVGQFYLKKVCRYDKLEEIEGKIAFYPMHVQPESSVEVLASFFTDQLKLITDIRRSLPFDMTLVVKEHPNILGLKSPRFFREIRRIPNVKLLKHSVPNTDVYGRSSVVFTISGTPGLEAGMLGIPAILFSPMYFTGFSSVRYCSDVTRIRGIVSELLDGFSRDLESDCRCMDRLLKSSYDGYWTDPMSDPKVLEPMNIRRLQSAFVDLLESDEHAATSERVAESAVAV
jgi:hypothetical protein